MSKKCYFQITRRVRRSDTMSPNMKKTKAVKTKNCRYHLAGRCTKGSRCLFRHPRLGKKAVTICMFDSRPNGCVKEDCQFVHMKGRPGHKSYLEEAHDLRRVLERSEKSDRVASSSETLLLDSDRNSPEYNSAFTGELSSFENLRPHYSMCIYLFLHLAVS